MRETDDPPPWAILHVPHASTTIPPEIRSQFVLSDAELEAEIGRMTDHATDALYGYGWPEEQVVKAAVSRLVVDVERFEDDAQEGMAAQGLGVIYTRTSDGRPLRRTLRQPEREALLDRWYRPHHRLLTDRVRHAVDRHGRALIVDAHSFPHAPLPYEDPTLSRPDICIGTDAFHTPRQIIDTLVAAFAARGFSIAIDAPFAGALVPAAFHGVDPRCQSVMVEVRRDLYVDERGVRRPDAFATIQQALRACLREVWPC